ncbi:enoyl-CoA hydratase/isomerase family protein [Bacillus infantis]|uniref:enoyl-CoA hydratase/isomerase family protein n=1 Tax=Bacillus infantis TaxID=324767 RepID=UPI003CF441C6
MMPYSIEQHEDGLLQFTINRPEVRNAINYEVMEGLREAVNLAGRKEVKALMITGAGGHAFCSGGDLGLFHSLKTEDEAFGMLSGMAAILKDLLFLPKPTVAFLNGAAVGGGCEIASACDFRIAAPGAKAGFIQGKLAITTGWGGGSILMEKLLPANALKMLAEASVYGCSELLELGFIHRISQKEALESCRDYLSKILRLDVNVLESYKRLQIKKWQNSHILQRIDDEVRRCAVLWEKDEHHAQVDKFLNRS